jgi:hypothetical protein
MLKTIEKEVDLSIDTLMTEACRSANLSEWGDDAFREPLSRLIDCFLDQYGAANDWMKKVSFRNAIRAILTNRLYIQHNFESFPRILAVPINTPLFIVGLSQTGSTLLHRLLAQDESCRVLKYWEMHYPFVGPSLGLNHEALSIRLAELKIKEIYSRFPDLHHIHQTKAADPEECEQLMRHSFCSVTFASEWCLPGYARWLIQEDMTACYRYFRKLLQLLLWYQPANFPVLKCSFHLLNLKTVLELFPDANILWLHRSPLEAIPASLSLLSVLLGDERRSKQFVEFILDYSVRLIERGMEVEQRSHQRRFLNMNYREPVRDPLAAILKIYDHFQYTIDSNMETNIRNWLEKNPRLKHGVPHYRLEDFGLREADVRERFVSYFDQYGHLL